MISYVFYVVYINVGRKNFQKFTNLHTTGICSIPVGLSHINLGRAEQGLTGLMVSALFITIYVEPGAQLVGFTTWSGKSDNTKVTHMWVIDMIWQLYLVFRDRLS